MNGALAMPAAGARNPEQSAYWGPLIEEVCAMKLHDLLIWDVPPEKKNSARTRLWNCQPSEFKTKHLWHGDKVFIVRVK